MLRKDYEVFYYCDDSIKDVALHHHDFYEIYLFLSGRVHYTVETRHYKLLPGDILLISPQELHQPVISRDDRAPYSRIVIWMSAEFMRNIGSVYSCDPARCFDINSPGHTNLLRLDAAQRKPVFDLAMGIVRQDSASDQYGGLLASAQLTELLVYLNRHRPAAPQHCGQENSLSNTLQAVVGYINAHLTEPLTLDRLAERHYISKYHLAHTFQQAMGTSVYRYITQKRLILAKQLLLENTPLIHIHKQCGFNTYSSFYRAFRAVYGISPREYRRALAAQPGERSVF